MSKVEEFLQLSKEEREEIIVKFFENSQEIDLMALTMTRVCILCIDSQIGELESKISPVVDGVKYKVNMKIKVNKI